MTRCMRSAAVAQPLNRNRERIQHQIEGSRICPAGNNGVVTEWKWNSLTPIR